MRAVRTIDESPPRPTLAQWPAQAALRDAAAGAGRPCLLVIEPGADIPVTGDLEDWIVRGSSELDVARRLEDLSAAAQRQGPPGTRAVVVLPGFACAADARVASALLLDAGRLVPRAHLTSDQLGDAQLDAAVARVRRSLAGSGWTIHRIAQRGFTALSGAQP
ncbi:MAG: hypothetical protein JWM47_2116 [Acidimicrobiales bacterium]|nr:hypothetical protein [Acidimicrobiales bacterium]